MRTVCIIRNIVVLGSCDNIGISFLIVFCKPVCSGLCRSSFKVIEITVKFLIIGKTFAHMVENIFCELLCFGMSNIGSEPFCVKADLIHTDKTDGGKMIFERAEISLCILR